MYKFHIRPINDQFAIKVLSCSAKELNSAMKLADELADKQTKQFVVVVSDNKGVIYSAKGQRNA